MDFFDKGYSIQQTNKRFKLKMPSKSKLARKEAEKKQRSPAKQAVHDKMSENIVNRHIMPSAFELANANFNSTDAKILLTKFQAKAFEYAKTQQFAKEAAFAELTATDTGLVLTVKKDIVVSVYLDKPMIINVRSQTDLLTKLKQDRDKSRKETFFFYHRQMEDCMWGTNEELLEQMKSWRKQKREKQLKILEGNNNEFVIDGKTYYTLVLTQLTEDGETQNIGFDKLAIGVNHFVDGLVYWFVAKANRDATYKYVMEIK